MKTIFPIDKEQALCDRWLKFEVSRSSHRQDGRAGLTALLFFACRIPAFLPEGTVSPGFSGAEPGLNFRHVGCHQSRTRHGRKQPQAPTNLSGGHRCPFPPWRQLHQIVHLFAAIHAQQLRQSVGGRKNPGPTVQHLPGLLPGLTPTPSVLHLLGEVFDGPAAGVVFEHFVGTQPAVGCQKRY